MNWLDRLLGRKDHKTDDERRELKNLHAIYDRVHARSERLERELRRVNEALSREARRR